MAKPNSRKGLKEYALRQLGHPIVEVNITDEQMEDLIDEAIQMYQIYHHEGQVKTYLKHEVTQTDVDNRWIPMPDNVIQIERALPLYSERNSNASMFDIKYQLHMNDIFDLSYAGSLSHMVQTKQYIDLLQLVLNGYEEVEYSRHEDRLYFPSLKWNSGGQETGLKAGDYIVVECHYIIDPETYTEVYNDIWLKRYIAALFKKQWGTNLLKFDGMQLPGGITIQGQAIYDQGQGDVMEAEQNLIEHWERPLGFLIG